MAVPDRVAELRRGIVRVEVVPKAPVLERHLERVNNASRRVGVILDDIRDGKFRAGMIRELDDAYAEKIEAVCEDMKVDRSIVVFDRVRIPLPPADYNSVA